MKKILLIIIISFGIAHHFRAELFNLPTDNSGAFDDIGNPEVIIFTSKNCRNWCEIGLQNLKDRQVPFKELSIDANLENQSLYKKLGRRQLPYLIAGNEKVAGFHKARYASALAENFGDQYLTANEKPYFKNHFYADGSAKIYMYGSSRCGYCQSMRKAFTKLGMDFEELDVAASSNKNAIATTIQIKYYPVIYVGYNRIERATIKKVANAVKLARNR